MSVLLETPSELLTVEFAVATVVHAAEHSAEATDAVGTSLLEDDEYLVEHLEGRFSGDAEDGVHVGAVAGAASGEGRRELLVVELPIVVQVVLAEEVFDLQVPEHATQSLQGLLELCWLNGAKALKIEMLEDLFHCLALVIISVSALTNLLENDGFNLGNAFSRDIDLASAETPGLQDSFDKVVVLLSW